LQSNSRQIPCEYPTVEPNTSTRLNGASDPSAWTHYKRITSSRCVPWVPLPSLIYTTLVISHDTPLRYQQSHPLHLNAFTQYSLLNLMAQWFVSNSWRAMKRIARSLY